MINISLPAIVDIFMQYLAVVVGEIEEIQDLMPNFFTQFVVNEDDISEDEHLYRKFKQNGEYLYLNSK